MATRLRYHSIHPPSVFQIHWYDGKVHRIFANEKPFKGKEVYFTNVAMYQKRSEPQRADKKKSLVEVGMAKPAKISVQRQKKKLVVRFADTPEPFVINVKPNTKKGKLLVISTKSFKSINAAS